MFGRRGALIREGLLYWQISNYFALPCIFNTRPGAAVLPYSSYCVYNMPQSPRLFICNSTRFLQTFKAVSQLYLTGSKLHTWKWYFFFFRKWSISDFLKVLCVFKKFSGINTVIHWRLNKSESNTHAMVIMDYLLKGKEFRLEVCFYNVRLLLLSGVFLKRSSFFLHVLASSYQILLFPAGNVCDFCPTAEPQQQQHHHHQMKQAGGFLPLGSGCKYLLVQAQETEARRSCALCLDVNRNLEIAE